MQSVVLYAAVRITQTFDAVVVEGPPVFFFFVCKRNFFAYGIHFYELKKLEIHGFSTKLVKISLKIKILRNGWPGRRKLSWAWGSILAPLMRP